MTKEVELEGNKLVTLQVFIFIAWSTRYIYFYSILLGILRFSSFILSLLLWVKLLISYGIRQVCFPLHVECNH